MSPRVSIARLTGAVLVLAPAVAPAQVPLVDPSGRPSAAPPAAAPAAPAPAPTGSAPAGGPVGGDGAAPSGPGGWYYDDTGAAPDSDDETIVLHAGPTPELHVVRRGDTLWDLSTYYFNDPWQWPKVWSYNPAITNPHWIYPGDLVRMVPRGMGGASTAAPVPVDPEGGTAAASGGPGSGLGTEPTTARRFEVRLRQVAFVENDALKSPMKVDGAVEEKLMLSAGDSIYVSYPENRPPKVGQRYSVYTLGNTVKHPKGGAPVGAYVRVLGQVEVQSVKKDKLARAVIIESNSEIERGAFVGPLVIELKTVPPARASVNAQGTIVAMLEKDALVGTGEVVFVDLGEKSGVEVGNRLYVVRRGDAIDTGNAVDLGAGQDDRRFPARALGEVVIVDVGRQVSIALVTLAVQEIAIGDLVMMQKAP